jgi:hypothetical protein
MGEPPDERNVQTLITKTGYRIGRSSGINSMGRELRTRRRYQPQFPLPSASP